MSAGPPPSRWRRLRFAPLYTALVAAGLLARLGRRRWPQRPRDEVVQRGVSILIPERGTPDLLLETLLAAHAEAVDLGEACEIIVVVNGAPRADYAALMQRFPDVRWQYHAAALGYNGAIVAGLSQVRHAWVYLLNSDMRLQPGALRALLPYRRPQVFAACSQIFFADPARRREETGWSDYVYEPDIPCVYERTPDASPLARGSLYPGGGSSLCRTSVLRRYARDSQPYSPFYWEDAEWGVRAWSEGWEVLFCPASEVIHQHRGTVNRYYAPDEVARVVRRNSLQFDLRMGWTGLSPRQLVGTIAREPEATRADLGTLRVALGAFRRRIGTRAARRRGLDYSILAPWKFFGAQSPHAERPRVLIVSPFALFPPAHGGARRIAELLKRLSSRVDFILLGDERSLYSAEAHPWLAPFVAVHLVEGRGDLAGEGPLDLPARIARHPHPKLRAELRRLVALYRPDVVQVEFMELAGLIDERQAEQRWLLALHDVYLDGSDYDATQNALMQRYDAVTVCSEEDRALLPMRDAHVIGNGASRRSDYEPSRADAELLFMGPFRYAPNRDGILAFLRDAWPAIRAAMPDARLTILGGAESAADRIHPLIDQAGVELISAFVDPHPPLARAALTINPQLDIRGSALKVIESLLAGRVCVTTHDGARGFSSAGLAGLVAVDGIAAMADVIIPLLRDVAHRHELERPDEARIAPFTWNGIADAQFALYRRLMKAQR